MVTRTQITDFISTIESTHGVTIIFASLGGSRGFNHFRDFSDYDVFVIYDGPKIKRQEVTINTKTVSVLAFPRWLYDEMMIDHQNIHYQIDNLRQEVVYVDTERYATNMLTTIESVVSAERVAEGIMSTIRYKWDINKNESSPKTKRYFQLLNLSMRYMWMINNNSILYPLDNNALLNEFSTEPWYNDAVTLFGSTEVFEPVKYSTIDTFVEGVANI